MIVGSASRPLAVALALSLLCPSLAAQEQEDVSVTVTPTQTGAVYDLKIGVDGLLVSESYILTRLTCRKTDKLVDVLMPITRADAEGQDGRQRNQPEQGLNDLGWNHDEVKVSSDRASPGPRCSCSGIPR